MSNIKAKPKGKIPKHHTTTSFEKNVRGSADEKRKYQLRGGILGYKDKITMTLHSSTPKINLFSSVQTQASDENSTIGSATSISSSLNSFNLSLSSCQESLRIRYK